MDSKTYIAKKAQNYALMGSIFFGLLPLVEGGLLLTRLSAANVISPTRGYIAMTLEWPLIIAVALFFTFLAVRTYQKIKKGEYASSQTSTFILGIFGLVPLFGGFFGGIFYLMTYKKLQEVLKPVQMPSTTIIPEPAQE